MHSGDPVPKYVFGSRFLEDRFGARGAVLELADVFAGEGPADSAVGGDPAAQLVLGLHHDAQRSGMREDTVEPQRQGGESTEMNHSWVRSVSM